MTGQQAAWLNTNRTWEAIGYGREYVKRAMLHPDGTLDYIQRGVRPPIKLGSFEVGERKAPPPGGGIPNQITR